MAQQDDKTVGSEDSEVVLLPPDQTVETGDFAASSDSAQDESATLKAQLADAQAQLAAERSRRAELETANADGAARLANESSARFAAQEATVEANIVSAQGALTAAKAAYTKANEEGRYADAADLAEQIADARTKLNASTYAKAQISDQKERAKADPNAGQPQRQQSFADPADAMLATIKSPESRRWLVEHRDVLTKMATDERYFARVSAADSEAYGSGIERDTPEYFDFIEGKLGIGAKTSRGTGSAAPPARRSATPSNGSAGRTIRLDDVVNRLTPSMRAAARTSFPDQSEADALKSYAKGIVISKQRDADYLPDFKL